MVALASGCKQLTTLDLAGCNKITDAAVVAVASGCKQLTTLDLYDCHNITDVAVVAVASGCKQLTTLDLTGCHNITKGLKDQWRTWHVDVWTCRTAPTSL